MSRKLPVLSGRELQWPGSSGRSEKSRLRRECRSGKGSHIFVFRADPPKGITVPNEKEVKRGTLRAIIRQAELTVEEFLALL
jgi:hypothetical protein